MQKLVFPKPSKHFGYVYIIEIAKSHIKIGRTKNPEKRIRAISTQSGFCPINVWISKESINFKEMEIEAHKVLSKYRIIGEYFDFDFLCATQLIGSLEFIAVTDLDNETAIRKEKEILNSMLGITKISTHSAISETPNKEDMENHFIFNEISALFDVVSDFSLTKFLKFESFNTFQKLVANQVKFVSIALDGGFKGIDRNELNSKELQVLRALEVRNAVLIGANIEREVRKKALVDLYSELTINRLE